MSNNCGSGSVNKTYIISGGDCESGSTCEFGPIIFDIDYVGSNLTYIGYGDPLECKILRVETLTGTTYTSYWSEGVEDLDKIWSNRLTYSYF